MPKCPVLYVDRCNFLYQNRDSEETPADDGKEELSEELGKHLSLVKKPEQCRNFLEPSLDLFFSNDSVENTVFVMKSKN